MLLVYSTNGMLELTAPSHPAFISVHIWMLISSLLYVVKAQGGC